MWVYIVVDPQPLHRSRARSPVTPRRTPQRPARKATARLEGRVGLTWDTPLTLRVLFVIAALIGALYGALRIWGEPALEAAGGANEVLDEDITFLAEGKERRSDRAVDGMGSGKRRDRPLPAPPKQPQKQPKPDPDPDHDAIVPDETPPEFHRFNRCPGEGRDNPRFCPSAWERR